MPITIGNTTITGLGVNGLPAGSIGTQSLANSIISDSLRTLKNLPVTQIARSVVTGRVAGANSYNYQPNGGAADNNRGLKSTTGSKFLEVTITPTFAHSLMLIMVSVPSFSESSNHSDQFFCGLWKNDALDPITTKTLSNRFQDNGLSSSNGSNHMYDVFCAGIDIASNTSARTYSWYAGWNGGGGVINGYGNDSVFGGQGRSSITAIEFGLPNTTTSTFDFTGATQTWTVPSGVTTATAFVWGAGGGTTQSRNGTFGGAGGFAAGRFNVSAGQTYRIQVGGGGNFSANAATAGGFAGGGAGGAPFSGNQGSCSGGGYSGVFLSNVAAGNAVIIAGGGGGGAGNGNLGAINGQNMGQTGFGGAGGGMTGQNAVGAYASNASGYGGTQNTGGSRNANTNGAAGIPTSGSQLQGGTGGQFISANNHTAGGGGGGGWYGGGGGRGGEGGITAGDSGGGGSGYLAAGVIGVTRTGQGAGQFNTTDGRPSAAETSSAYWNTNVGAGGIVGGSGGNGRVVIVYS
jgi:hypothetical protein